MVTEDEKKKAVDAVGSMSEGFVRGIYERLIFEPFCSQIVAAWNIADSEQNLK